MESRPNDKNKTKISQCGLLIPILRAHLHLATATSLRHRCDVAPRSNQLFWCCIVTPSDCDVAAMALGNRFVSHWERCRSDIADASLSLDVNGP